MAPVPERVAERLVAGIQRFQPILAAARARYAGENETATFIKDMFAGVFGYDTYSEVTSEFSTRRAYRDLSIETDRAPHTLIAVKAAGHELDEDYMQQPTDYASHRDVDWVLHTNGITWRIYHLTHSRPIDQELVIDMDFMALDPLSDKDVELLYFVQRGLAAIGPWRIADTEMGPVEALCRCDAGDGARV